MKTKSVSEHKHVEKELRHLKDFYWSILERVINGVWMTDKKDVINYANRGMGEIAGMPPEKIVGARVLKDFPEETLKHFRPLYNKAKKTMKPLEYNEIPVTTPAGRESFQSGWLIPLGEAGEFNGMICTVEDITERKLVEKDLSEKKEILERIFKTTHFHVVLLDSKCNFIRVNRAYADTCGFDPDYFIGKNHFDLYPSEELESKFRRVVETGDHYTVYSRPFEFPDQPERGITYWDLAIYPVKKASGEVEGLLFTLLEVTERVLVEKELERSKDYLEKLHNTLGDPIFSVKLPERTIDYVNFSVEAIFGYKPEECIGKSTEIFYPERKEYLAFGRKIKSAIEQKEDVLHTDPLLKRKSGEVFPSEITTAFFKENGKVSQVISTVRDITERKRVEDALRESEEKYRDLYDNAPDMYHSLDKNGIVIDCNETEAGMLGYKKEEIVGRPLADFLTEESRILFEKDFSKLNKEKTLQNLEREFVRKDGTTFTASLNVFFEWGEDGKLIKTRTIARDITERKRAEDALRNIAQGVSAKTGGEFFKSLVLHLTKALDVDYVLVGELMGSKGDRVETIAICAQGEIVDNFVYNLSGTPCKNVLGGDICSYPSNVQQQFPNDHLLGEMGIESYMGAPLFDSADSAMGLIAVMDSTEFSNVPLMKSMLQIFAVRASAELERRQADEELKRLYDELEERVEERTSELSNANMQLNEEVSQRKQMENELLTVAEDWKVTFDSISEGLSIHDADMNIVRANKALGKILSVSPEELIGKKCFFVFHDCPEPIEECPMGRSAISKMPEHIEIFEPHLNSWLSLSVYPKFDEKGEVSGVVHVTRDITERKWAEGALKESEKKYRHLVDNALVGVYKTNLEGEVLYVNEALSGLLEYESPEELIEGGALSKYKNPKDREVLIKKLKKTGKVDNFEIEVLTKTGKTKNILLSAAFDGDVLSGMVIDMTERKRAEEELGLLLTLTRVIGEAPDFNSALEVVLRSVCEATGWSYGDAWIPCHNASALECAPSWYGGTSRRLRKFRQVNEGLKFQPNEGLTGRVWSAKQPEWIPDVSAVPEKIFRRVKAAREVGLKAGFGVPIIAGEDVLAVLGFFMFESSEEDEHLVELVSTVAAQLGQVVERKRAEESLRDSEERYRALFNTGDDAVFVSRPTKDGMPGKFIEVNDVACERLGYTRGELLNLSPGDISIIESGIIRENMKKLNSGEHVIFEAIHIKKKGKNIPVEINSLLFDLGGRPAVLSIARDVTERMKSHEEIRSSLREKEVLLQEVHHRVKNNLQFISSLLSLQSKQIKNKEDFRVFKSSQSQIKAMALLHEELYSAENLENINFEEYTRKLLASLLHSYGASPDTIALRVEVSNTIRINKAIPCGLIINELVSNSLKYAFSEKKRGVLQIKFLRGKGCAKLVVSDNGAGIPEGIDFKDTETFGLKLVNMLVEQLDGKVELDRKSGTKFTITFDEK